jgi:hypothetical protein
MAIMEWGKPSGLPRLPAARAATIPEIMMRLEESHHDLICLFEHDLLGKPVPLFRIMLYATLIFSKMPSAPISLA